MHLHLKEGGGLHPTSLPALFFKLLTFLLGSVVCLACMGLTVLVRGCRGAYPMSGSSSNLAISPPASLGETLLTNKGQSAYSKGGCE